MASPLAGAAFPPAVRFASATQPKPVRYGFVDLLRGFALVVMVETHILNAYLPAGSRNTATFFWLTFFNGLVAPTFLFASGFSIILQGSRQWDDWLHFRLPFWKQMRRLGFITLVAYYCHLDDFKLSRYLHHPDNPNIWRATLQVDILQCIVASLILVHLLIFVLRKPARVAWGAGALCLAAVVATPWIWALDFQGHFPLSLALFLNPHGISLFPIFPWAGFVLAGSCASFLFLKSVEKGRQDLYMRLALPAGVLMILGALAGRSVPFSLPGHQSFFTTSPLYVVLRLGCVLIICALLFLLERRGRLIPVPIQVAGRESLLVYGVHLWVIFGFLRGKRLMPVLGGEAGYAGCVAMSLVVGIFMLWLATNYHNFKRQNPKFTRYAQAAAVFSFALVFLLR